MKKLESDIQHFVNLLNRRHDECNRLRKQLQELNGLLDDSEGLGWHKCGIVLLLLVLVGLGVWWWKFAH